MKQVKDDSSEQGSIAWHNWRKHKIGSSEIGTVMGVNPYQTPYQLWEIKTGLVEAPDLSQNYHVKRGVALEPKARELFNETTGSNFHPATFNHDEFEFIGASADGFDAEKNEVIEIKCMGIKSHEKVMNTGEPIDYYIPQIQYLMLNSGADRCHFISYCPEHPDPFYYVTVLADKDYQDKMIAEAKKFWKLVETKTPPKLTDADFKIVENEDTKLLADLYRKALADKKAADEKLDAIKEKIKQIVGEQKTRFYGLKCYHSKRSGAIDYSKIPELKQIDLEPYRKKDINIFYVSETEKIL